MAKQEIELENTRKVEAWDYVKKKRRWAFFWGALIATIVVCVINAASNLEPQFPPKRDQIAAVKIDGGIFDDEYRTKMLREIKERDDVKALIVHVNSPGGAVYPSERLYEDILAIGEDIPVVTLMHDYAASGGYATALAADYIVAGRTTVTGSIGVISEIPNISDVLDRWGIETTVVRSSEAKGGISPFRDPTPQEIADQEALIGGMYDWFKGLVGERRGLSGGKLNAVTRGDVYTGEQALALDLVDEIGGLDEALAYLHRQDEALEDIEVVDWEPLYPEYAGGNFVGAMAEDAQMRLKQAVIDAKTRSFEAVLR